MAETGLGKAFEKLGISGWEKVYPGEVCKNCLLQITGCFDGRGRPCRALIVIGMMATNAITAKDGVSVDPKKKDSAKRFLANLKRAIHSQIPASSKGKSALSPPP